MNNSCEEPIFIIGTPRSGTTLAAHILGRHTHLFMPGETHYFDDIFSRRNLLGDLRKKEGADNIAERLYSLYRRYNEPKDQERIERLFTVDKLSCDIRNNCNDYGEVLSLFMKRQMDSEKKNSWGNNTPRDLFNVTDIVKFYPRARFILCVRDPRDFLVSYKGKWRATAKEEVNRLKKIYHPVVTAYLWKTSMRRVSKVISSLPKNRAIILKYEDLVLFPEKKVKDLCDFIGQNYEKELLEVDFSNSSNRNEKTKGIFSSSIGKWRKNLAPEDGWIVQKLCGKEMDVYGYEPEPVNCNPIRLAVLVMSTPIALWRGLNANKHKRGPLLPYLLKRVGVSRAGG